MKAVVAAFNQEKALVGAFSAITNLCVDFRYKLYLVAGDGEADGGHLGGEDDGGGQAQDGVVIVGLFSLLRDNPIILVENEAVHFVDVVLVVLVQLAAVPILGHGLVVPQLLDDGRVRDVVVVVLPHHHRQVLGREVHHAGD